MDCCPPGSSVHGILQARILEWVAISYSRDILNQHMCHWKKCRSNLKGMNSQILGFLSSQIDFKKSTAKSVIWKSKLFWVGMGLNIKSKTWRSPGRGFMRWPQNGDGYMNDMKALCPLVWSWLCFDRWLEDQRDCSLRGCLGSRSGYRGR